MLVRRRSLQIALLFVAVGVLALESLHWSRFLPVNDFVEYWSASRLFMSGGSPYSPDAILITEQTVGWPETRPLMMLNPPWTLPLIAWMGLLPFRIAQLLWFLLSVAVVFGSADYLWAYYGGARQCRWIALVLAASLVPTLMCLKLGQITCFMLAGLVAFLGLLRSQRWFLAGASLLLLGLKPQLLYLVVLAVLFWIVAERRWMVAAGALFAYSVAMAAALLWNPSALLYFSVVGPQTAIWVCSLGGVLRLWFGAGHLWLQFVPSVIGTVWSAWWWTREYKNWSWAEQMPLLVLVSLCTTAYGWYYDQLLALTALIPAAVMSFRNLRRSVVVLSAYIGTNLIMLTLNLSGFMEPWFFWASFAWIAIYIAAVRQARPIGSTVHAQAAHSN